MKRSDAVRRHNLLVGRTAVVAVGICEMLGFRGCIKDPISTTCHSSNEDQLPISVVLYVSLDTLMPLKDVRNMQLFVKNVQRSGFPCVCIDSERQGEGIDD